ncbi:MAG: hypothetical protein BAJALOKI2v1_800005 [Promethearchaeota archaeon]|nr:MAG: hypothetical protein BAJALOKI2v1_800005 [Candidatus Lokiarchaeota archaeon]
MKIKLIVKNRLFNGKEKLSLWIEKYGEIKEEIEQIFTFFEDSINVKEKRRLSKYYVISSENPAIILSLSSAIQEIVAEKYFMEN